MDRDIFQFWSEMPEGAFEHPADRLVLERLEGGHGLSRDCFPGPYAGPLRTAPVVLLFLSPGLDQDDPKHCESEDAKLYYARQRTGEEPLPTKREHESAYKWLNKIIKQFDISYEQARTTVATLNIGAYKSKTFDDWGMLAALPSSRVTLDWAQSVLFPEAETGKRIVVCLRSPRYWGLKVGEPRGNLYCPECVRSAFMRRGEMRNRIVAAVTARVEEALRSNSV